MVRELIGLFSDRDRIEARFKPLVKEELALGKLVSYSGNKGVPFLRLYRYKEAFSTKFVEYFLDYFRASKRDVVFDPFAGMGTTLFTSMMRGIPSVGLDRLPVAVFVAETLPKFLALESGCIMSTFELTRKAVSRSDPADLALDVPIIDKAFDPATLLRLRQWKSVLDSLESPIREVMILLFLSILENTSYTSNDGQFLRLRPDKTPEWPDDALRSKVEKAEEDIRRATLWWSERDLLGSLSVLPTVIAGDTRCLQSTDLLPAPTILITSPPYANRYDYTRSYALELCFYFVRSFEELRALRHNILRSHIESKTSSEDEPVHPTVSEVVNNLGGKSLNNPRIPYMLIAYFVDMEKAIQQWAKILSPGARVALVVDNVRFEGEMLPVDLVLSEIAERHGFKVSEVVVARYKGNSSQQMGKYGRERVRESIVLWEKT